MNAQDKPHEPASLREPAAARWLLLLLLCPALVWGCWSAGFIRYDDPMVFSWGGTASFADAFRYHPEHQLYYPLTLLSWYFDKLVWAPILSTGLGENGWAAGIRITNVVLHALAAVFLWQTLRALRAPGALAAFVTAGFALHPTVCESICWAVERKNVLAGCLTFAAFGLYVRAATNRRGMPLALAAFAAALLSKPSALALFPIMLAWEILGRPAFDGSSLKASAQTGEATRWKSATQRLLPWAVLSAGCGALSYVLHQKLVLPPPGGSIWTAMLTDAEILRRYLMNVLFPVRLSFFYGVTPIVSLTDGRLWGHLLMLGVIVGGTLGLCDPARRRSAVFAWLWFLGGMVTSLNMISISFLMQDRYIYMAAPGFWLALGLSVQGLFTRMNMQGAVFRRLAAAAVLVAAGCWTLASSTRSHLFAESALLFEDAAAKEPESAYARIFFAQELEAQANNLRNKGKPMLSASFVQKAIAQYEAGMATPDFERYLHQHTAKMDLALLYYERGDYPQAGKMAEASLVVPEWLPLLDENRLRAERLTGMAAYKQRSFESALAHFEKAEAYAGAADRENLGILKGQTALEWSRDLDSAGEIEKAKRVRAAAISELKSIPEGSASFELAKKLVSDFSTEK